MGDKQLDIPPGILKAVERAVETAVSRKLEGMSLVSLQKCQEELEAARYALADMGQKFETWRKLAELRGDQSEARGAQIDDLQQEVTKLHAEIALLRSVLENEASDERGNGRAGG